MATDAQHEDIVQFIFGVRDEPGISCEECYLVVDQYVDMLRAGRDPSVVMADVQKHLDACPACAEELQALLSILDHTT